MSIFTTLINTVTGGVLEKTADKLLDMIPDKLSEAEKEEYALKLKTLLHQQQLDLVRVAQEQEQAYLADVQSARAREMSVVQSTGQKDTWLYYLASALVLGFFVILGIVIYRDLSQNQTANIMLGYLGGSFTSVIAYFFGSSQGSRDKTKLLNEKTK